jgi:ABC-2 type transport system ATP-binding protein
VETNAASAEPVLVAEHLTKRFGSREAVSDVSFTLHAGEVLGFLGPNGAGKTTTIRMLVGLARPTKGRIRVRGLDLSSHFREAMTHIGSIVESPDLYKYLTGRENLAHFARMLPAGAAERIETLADMVQLRERLDDRVATYSLGMRQRLGIAQALLGNPDVLVLDEPANGLDPAGIREIRELVRHLAEDRGISVFVSSHLLSEIELMCDRVAIIHRGRTLAAGPVHELLDRFAGDRIVVRARPAAVTAERLAAAGASDVEASGPELVTARLDPARVPEAMRALVAAGVDVYSVERPASSLEDAFLRITGGETV